MIIEFPTALYNTVLPQEPEDSESVTFTISSEDPPRDITATQELPIAEKLRPLPDKIFSQLELREVLGDFVFSISEGSQNDVGSGKKQFEVGQFIDFGVESEIDAINLSEVPEQIDLQQNTNILDLSEFGLTDQETKFLSKQAESKMNELVIELNDIKSNVKDNEVAIVENQKSINEVRKTIKAVEVILDDSEGNELLEKLRQSEADLVTQRDALIADINELNDLAKIKFQELLDTRELVR